MGKSRVTLTTYYRGLEVHKRDSVEFTVPFEWLEPIVVDEYNMTVDEFRDNYTWDDSERIKEMAQEDGVFKYASGGGA